MTKKAGRLHGADLTAAIGKAGDLAKARIVQLDGEALDAIAGGFDPSDPGSDTTIVIGLPNLDDIATDGMAPSDDGPLGDILGGGDETPA